MSASTASRQRRVERDPSAVEALTEEEARDEGRRAGVGRGRSDLWASGKRIRIDRALS